MWWVGSLLAAYLMSEGLAGSWPAWRGPTGNGISSEKNLPLGWGGTHNVRWRVPLPGPGNSTPIVWKDSVFITQALGAEPRCTVMCFDVRDGQLRWQAGPTLAQKDSTHEDNPRCSPSPVTDGRRVIAWFGTAGVYAFDMEGRELWHRDLGRQAHVWGYASSPVLYRDLCLLSFGPGPRSFLIALDKRTGRTVWQYDLPLIRPDAKWQDFGGEASYDAKAGLQKVSEIAGSWSTPLVVRGDRGDEVVLSRPLQLMAWNPDNGQLLWTCGGPNIGAYSSAFGGDGTVAVAVNGFSNVVMAVRPGGRGDVTATHRSWCRVMPESQACIGSGVIHQGRIYQATYMGFVQCLDLQTGKTLWEERLKGAGAKNSSWSSPVLAGDRLYVPNQSADVFVVRAGPKFECLATNSIGGEPLNASLAASGGAVFMRTHRRLWCLSVP